MLEIARAVELRIDNRVSRLIDEAPLAGPPVADLNSCQSVAEVACVGKLRFDGELALLVDVPPAPSLHPGRHDWSQSSAEITGFSKLRVDCKCPLLVDVSPTASFSVPDPNRGQTLAELPRIGELWGDRECPGLVDITPDLIDPNWRQSVREGIRFIKLREDDKGAMSVDPAPLTVRGSPIRTLANPSTKSPASRNCGLITMVPGFAAGDAGAVSVSGS